MKKKMWLCTAALAVGCLLPQAAMADEASVNIVVNGYWVTCDETTGAPYINDSGRTMVPLRVVNDSLDYTTDWTSDGRIHISGKDSSVDVTVQAGSTDYTANGETGQFETAPVIREDGRTYLPARDFGELYGSVYWDGETRKVWIYDGDELQYHVIGSHIVRFDETGAKALPLSDGWTVVEASDGDFIQDVTVVDGKNYVLVGHAHNFSGDLPLFRDDGEGMTYIVTMNETSSFAIDGDTVYHTMGTDARAWTNHIVPERLYATPIGNDDATTSYTLDFAVNECVLAIEDGNLIATAPDGTRHVVELATLVPDAE